MHSSHGVGTQQRLADQLAGAARSIPVETYLPGYQLDGIILEGLQMLKPRHKDLLQLAVSIGLEGHPGEAL